MKDKFLQACTWIGLLLILVGLCIPFFTPPQSDIHKYIFAVGAGLNFIGRLFTRYEVSNLRVKRLVRIELWSALFFCVAAFMMFYDNDPRNWIVFVLAGGALLVYTSIMIPRIQSKDAKK